jgi:hypothetical protein
MFRNKLQRIRIPLLTQRSITETLLASLPLCTKQRVLDVIVIYVDDLVLSANSSDLLSTVNSGLKEN